MQPIVCRLIAFAFLGLFFVGCGSSASPQTTEVSVRIEADISLQATIRSVRVLVRNDDATERSNQSIDTSSSFFAGWPWRTSLRPRSNVMERYEVVAEASNASGAVVGRARVVSGFLPHAKAELVLWFLGDCTAQCPTGFSCGRDARGTTGCLPDERMPTPIEDAGVAFDANPSQDAGLDVTTPIDAGACGLEICGNSVDDDCNGLIDDCASDSGIDGGVDAGMNDASRCVAEICGNLIDDDCNGLIDDCNPNLDASMHDAAVGPDGGVSQCLEIDVCEDDLDNNCNGIVNDGCSVATSPYVSSERQATQMRYCQCGSETNPSICDVNRPMSIRERCEAEEAAKLDNAETANCRTQEHVRYATCLQQRACSSGCSSFFACVPGPFDFFDSAVRECQERVSRSFCSQTFPSQFSALDLDLNEGTNSFDLCGASNTSEDVSIQFVPTESRIYTISTGGTQLDTLLAVFDGCESQTTIACNDDRSSSSRLSSIAVHLEAGHLYKIVVDAWNTSQSASLAVTLRVQ